MLLFSIFWSSLARSASDRLSVCAILNDAEHKAIAIATAASVSVREIEDIFPMVFLLGTLIRESSASIATVS